jgi:hypothetical protein
MSLPDTDLSNNWKLNSQATPPFEVLNVDLGDKAWGRNLLRVHVKNTTDQKRSLKVHIGTGRRRGDGRCGFGMGKRYTIEPQEDRWIDHWYWVPPAHGVVDAVVTLRDLTGRRTKVQPPAFLTRSYELHFSIPNSKCNNLTITEKLPVFKKFFKGLRRLEPFGHFATEHFVFYCSPNTPAYAEIKKIMTQRESALKRACDFIGVKPSQQIVVFFYPDRITKRMCTHHEGDGLAHGNTIHEVYNDKVKLDPYHETVHIVMRPMGNPPAVFNEGFAVYMQEGHRWHGLHVDVIAAKLAQGGRRADLKKLLTREEIGSQNDDGKVAYPQSGSFVGFLIESFGKDKFLQAYKELKNPRNKSMQSRNKRTLERIYGRSLHELEREWQSMLEAADVP